MILKKGWWKRLEMREEVMERVTERMVEKGGQREATGKTEWEGGQSAASLTFISRVTVLRSYNTEIHIYKLISYPEGWPNTLFGVAASPHLNRHNRKRSEEKQTLPVVNLGICSTPASNRKEWKEKFSLKKRESVQGQEFPRTTALQRSSKQNEEMSTCRWPHRRFTIRGGPVNENWWSLLGWGVKHVQTLKRLPVASH